MTENADTTVAEQAPATKLPRIAEPAGSPAAGRTAREQLESRAAFTAVAAFLVSAVAIGIWMFDTRVPLSGGGFDALGPRASLTAGVCTGAAFAISLLAAQRTGSGSWRLRLPRAKRVLDATILTIALAVLAGLIVEAVAGIFQRGFTGMTVDMWGGAALAGAAAAFLAYIATLVGASLTTASLAQLAVLVLFMGTMASMLTAPNERWWEYHFSALGNQEGSGSAAAFNGALVLTGLILIVFANYAGRDARRGMRLHGLQKNSRNMAERGQEAQTGGATGSSPFWTLDRRTAAVTWGFVVIGLCMMIVGLVHDAVNTPVHVAAASGMVVMFALIAVFAMTQLPGFRAGFTTLTLGVMAGIAVSILLWVPLDYYALTGVELISAGLLFSWLIVFARTISIYAQREH